MVWTPESVSKGTGVLSIDVIFNVSLCCFMTVSAHISTCSICICVYICVHLSTNMPVKLSGMCRNMGTGLVPVCALVCTGIYGDSVYA